MCLAMYLFTENIIEETEWNEKKRKIFIEDITKNENGKDNNVINWNENNKKIYYIGSYLGCGCGWRSPKYGSINMDDEKKREELEYKVNDRNDLFQLLTSKNFKGSFIIVCWEGEQGNEIKQTLKLNIENIKNIDYDFEELVKYTL